VTSPGGRDESSSGESLSVILGDLAHRMAQPIGAISLAAELADMAIGRADLVDAAKRINVIMEEVEKLKDIRRCVVDIGRGATPAHSPGDRPAAIGGR
jgi:hypothetical protein